MSVLAVRDLAVGIGAARPLTGVSFDIAAGEVLGLVGESGSGKSLCALALLGLLPEGALTTGTVRFQGRDLTRLSETELARVRGAGIGLVFQEPATALNPLLSIGAQVEETVRVHRRGSRARARARAT